MCNQQKQVKIQAIPTKVKLNNGTVNITISFSSKPNHCYTNLRCWTRLGHIRNFWVDTFLQPSQTLAVTTFPIFVLKDEFLHSERSTFYNLLAVLTEAKCLASNFYYLNVTYETEKTTKSPFGFFGSAFFFSLNCFYLMLAKKSVSRGHKVPL